MKHSNLIIIIAMSFLALMVSCMKTNNPGPNNMVSISGKLVQSCDIHSPLAGLKIYLTGDKHPTFSSCSPKYIYSITDEEGNFNISFHPRDICMKEDAFLSLAIDTNNFKKTILLLPEYQELKQGYSSDVVVYYHNYRSYNVQLRVENDFSSTKDTIAYYKKDNGNPLVMFNRFIPGPFVNEAIVDTFVFSGQHLDPSSGHYVDAFYIKKDGEEHFTKIQAKTLSNKVCDENVMQVIIP